MPVELRAVRGKRGTFGVEGATPILTVGGCHSRARGHTAAPWSLNQTLAIRSVMTVSSSIDHRLIDGELGGTRSEGQKWLAGWRDGSFARTRPCGLDRLRDQLAPALEFAQPRRSFRALPARLARSITRLTVLRVVPQISAAPR